MDSAPPDSPAGERPHEARRPIGERTREVTRHRAARPARLRHPVTRAAGMEGSLGRVPDQDELWVLDQVFEIAGPPLVKPPRVVVGNEAATSNLRNDVIALIGDHAEEAGVD